jgi:hypothetical protein
MSRTKFLALIPGLLLSAGALAQEATLQLLPTPLELPARIGPLVVNPTPHKYDPPGMGMSWQYGMPGANLTVYVYDAQVADIEDGADTIPVCIEYEVAKQGVTQAYKDSKLLSQHLVKLLPPEESPLIREAVYEIVRDGEFATSYVWVTAVSGQFIKLRFSVDQRLREELPDARRAILSALGNAIKPHLAPMDPQAKKPGTSIGVNIDSLNDDLGAAGFMYTMLLSSLAKDAPENLPVCGGPVVPTYQTELGLYRTLFVDSDDRKTRVGKQVVKAEQAGFLEELVWMELHRPSWGDTPPDGLALAEYSAWKKKNLKNFRPPAFGTVNVNYPRPLPLEPGP